MLKSFKHLETPVRTLRVKKSATGEFRSDLYATKITYIVKACNPRAADVPHASWLAEDRGFLMFADLIPADIARLSVEFVFPAGWTVESSIAPDGNGRHEVLAPEKSVFFLGRLLRKASKSVNGMML